MQNTQQGTAASYRAEQEYLATLNDVECECGCKYFEQKMGFKKISAFDPKNTSGVEQIIGYQVVLCDSCKKVFEG